jgi:hypothetical protein
MKFIITVLGLFLLFPELGLSQSEVENTENPPIYIAFLWHMHQPIYFPGETIVETQQAGHYEYNVFDIHNERTGPYTNWPADAIQKGINANLPNLGASVSFSGSLIENLNALEANGNGNFQNWKAPWRAMSDDTTSLGNQRLDMIGFGYHHPLMGLIDEDDIRSQIQRHKAILTETFNVPYSKGIFPPENAFEQDMIPALVKEGIEWALVDNVHFDRAADGYQWNSGGSVVEANKADVRNPDPGDWVQLNNLWAPTKISAQWGHQPHFVEYTNPETGEEFRMIAVPTSRYLGNEDGRGGFGALQYEDVLSQLEPYNTDPDHPILVVLHHDGDNHGGGSSGYYGSNFQSFVDWVKGQTDRFVATTVQDYLDQFPPADNDVIHVESGSWAGADAGDPEFKKWLGDPGTDGYSPDRHSWSVLTAAQNALETVKDANPTHPGLEEAKDIYYNAQASDYWYWDGSLDGIWDSHPARAANILYDLLDDALSVSTESTPPSIFDPQREPYNPGEFEWSIPADSDFEVWTYAHDVSGMDEVTLFYRTQTSGQIAAQNKVYGDLNSWQTITMTGTEQESRTTPIPETAADLYKATISGVQSAMVDYFVMATDIHGNSAKTNISHVWVGDNSGSGGGDNGGGSDNSNLTISPDKPTRDDQITISIANSTQGAMLHWGVNNVGSTWVTPNESYWPQSTELFNGSGPAVESPFTIHESEDSLSITIGPFNDEAQSIDRVRFVIHYENDTWENNGGNDYGFDFEAQSDSTGGGDGGEEPPTNVEPFVMDGALDGRHQTLVQNGDNHLNLGWNGKDLYISIPSAQQIGSDAFIYVSDGTESANTAPWAKAGTVTGLRASLGNESSNNYAGWNEDRYTGGQFASANITEAYIDLYSLFNNKVPDSILVAAVYYGTNDGDDVEMQIPSGNGDNIIEAGEYATFDLTAITTNTQESSESAQPQQTTLSQNYPNPFNPATTISYSLSTPTDVELTVYNLLGMKVTTLVSSSQSAGDYSVQFDASRLASGVYLYQLKAGNLVETRKMILMK